MSFDEIEIEMIICSQQDHSCSLLQVCAIECSLTINLLQVSMGDTTGAGTPQAVGQMLEVSLDLSQFVSFFFSECT